MDSTNNRVDKNNYYLDIADAVAERSTCLRKHYGAVIVNNDEIVSTGYNGSPRGVANCNDRGQCERIRLGVPRGTNYTICCSTHSEQNAIISASRKEMLGGTLYLSGKEHDSGEYVKDANCCSICKRMIINAGISRVIIRDNKESYRVIDVNEWKNDISSLMGINGY